MINFIKRIPWKDVLVTILVVALGVGAIVGVGSALTAKTKAVSPLVFARGAIDSTGAFVKSDTSIYTEDYIECQGLKIEADFDATGTYQVFYYDSNKQFVVASDVYDTSTNPVYDKGNTFALAKYCQIVITPDVPMDDDGYLTEDYKIKFYEVAGIAGKFNITVNKNQNFASKILELSVGRTGGYYGEDKGTFVEQGNVHVSKFYEVEKYRTLSVSVPVSETTATFIVQFFDDEGNNLDFDWMYGDGDNAVLSGDFWIYTVEIPRDAVDFCIVLCNGYETLYEAGLVS